MSYSNAACSVDFDPFVGCHPVDNNVRTASTDIKPNQLIVPVVEKCSYNYFFQNHLNANYPCVIPNVGRDWNASKLWCKDEKPCFEYLKNQYGESIITVYHCVEQYFDSHTTSNMKFKEYIEYWKQYNEIEDKTRMNLYYLKDWHLKNEYKDDEFYTVPPYFQSDWLNEYLVANGKDDYRFVYMGPAGSWTTFHSDVLNTYSWSVNVCGLKRWILFPPGEEKKLMNGNRLPSSIKRVPRLVRFCEVFQSAGVALFVPSGWHHLVWNVDDTISINHNWVNAANINYMNIFLRQSLEDVEKEMRHLSKDINFRHTCQMVLKQHVGMNHGDFFELIRFIILRRIEKHVSNTQNFNLMVENDWNLYDLHKCREVLSFHLLPYLTYDKREEAAKLLRQMASVVCRTN